MGVRELTSLTSRRRDDVQTQPIVPIADVRDVLTQSAHFTSENPISYMVDGDLYVGGNTLELAIGPTVRFVI